MAESPLTERELRFVRELVRHQVHFLIVGLSAAALGKRAADRPKDRRVVPVLEQVLALQAARSREKD